MDSDAIKAYHHIREGGSGFYEQKRGLIAVWGKEAVQFLDGLVTNNVKELADGEQMLAAFPNAQGRLLAIVRVRRQAEKFLFETEDATRTRVFENLFRFTFAGDFFVEDRSDKFSFFEIFGPEGDLKHDNLGDEYHGTLAYELPHGAGYFVPVDQGGKFRSFLIEKGCVAIDDDLYETLRIEAGVPRYGVDVDETTVVPELGLDGMISYKKGCYIGQEIIARIHFRGHVAKRLTGLVSEPGAIERGFRSDAEVTESSGKNAGRITSVAFSPNLNKTVALAFVRHEHLPAGTELSAGGSSGVVTDLPFIE